MTPGALVLHWLTLGWHQVLEYPPSVSRCNTRAPDVVQVLASVTPERLMWNVWWRALESFYLYISINIQTYTFEFLHRMWHIMQHATQVIHVMQKQYFLPFIVNECVYEHNGNLCEPILFLLLWRWHFECVATLVSCVCFFLLHWMCLNELHFFCRVAHRSALFFLLVGILFSCDEFL